MLLDLLRGSVDKLKRWHLFLIFSVLVLTLYNVAPTVLYYTKPLKETVDAKRADEIREKIAERVDSLEQESADWVLSLCRHLQIKPLALEVKGDLIHVRFSKTEEADRLRAFLPRSGALIAFAPAQLALAFPKETGKDVSVLRKIDLRLQDHPELFSFFVSNSSQEREFFLERAAHIAHAVCAPSQIAKALAAWEQKEAGQPPLEMAVATLEQMESLFVQGASASERFLSTFTQGSFRNRDLLLEKLSSTLDQARDQLKLEKNEALMNRLIRVGSFLKTHRKNLEGKEGVPLNDWKSSIATEESIPLKGSPFFSSLKIDWEKKNLSLHWHEDLAVLEKDPAAGAAMQQAAMEDLARLRQITGETVEIEAIGKGKVSIPLHTKKETSSFLAFDLKKLGHLEEKARIESLKSRWSPSHPDFKAIPVVTPSEYEKLSEEQKNLCLLVYAPVVDGGAWKDWDPESLYVIPKGVQALAAVYRNHPKSERTEAFLSDLGKLEMLLTASGFEYVPLGEEGVFEKPFFAKPILEATREDLAVRGVLGIAVLELSNVEQRIHAENQIETAIHKELLQWEEDYRLAQVNARSASRFDVPPPTRSTLWNHFCVSFAKLFRGDEKKVLRWGLDLSGGKSVQIELKTAQGELVKEDLEIQRGMAELQQRVNRLGVSEVSIRQLGHSIVLDFPGGQTLSAEELICSSSMQFHVVDEKFSPSNPEWGPIANRFLQEIWNEAYVLRQTDAAFLQGQAEKHLAAGKTQAARLLKEAGFSLGLGDHKVVRFRGDSPREWGGQGHPLLIVFYQPALQGADLEEIRAAYDPSKGNYLSFSVRKGRPGGWENPQKELYHWTSRYSKEGLAGTEEGKITPGRGWRMAVVLNDTVISAPSLESPLKESAMISGSFSPREAARLAADLKAGSLSFTPHIVSEKNISPELGRSERNQGFLATGVALLLVIGAMLLWYRFAGLVAAVAVLFNLLILWAVLQNLGAALTLGGIAGIILTVGMAVDANVLVFERIKEEYERTKNEILALNAGYKRAFSAIFDSNVTTVLAALILLSFNAGPVQSFAVNLIIGVISSMFTALFMTRTFFQWWIRREGKKELKMPSWITKTNLPFLRLMKPAIYATCAIALFGLFAFAKEGKGVLGMDFTGGYALQMELKATEGGDEAEKVEKALYLAGFSPQDVRVKTLSSSRDLRVFFSSSVDREGAPFASLSGGKEAKLRYVRRAIEKSGLSLTSESQKKLSSEWSAMSGQISSQMQTRVLIGLGAAFLAMFLYLIFRFEFPFAAAALLCLLHDVLLTIAIIGILILCKVPVQFDLTTVAALMTIIGYSINDTIIIFDRIREERKLSPGESLPNLVHRSLNATLSRTVMTSGTTLLVVLALVFLGGASLFSFSLVMAIGIVIGTLSSWFIASPLLLALEKNASPSE